MSEEWRCFETTLATVEANLALDDALLERAEARDGPPLVRVWEAQRLAVVLGASGRVGQEVHVEACRADGVAILRRSSGGGTVVIGPGALNVTVVQPIAAETAYAAVDTAQLAVLTRLAESLRVVASDIGVAGSGDLVVGDRKFAGSAQRRLRRWFLIHTSILYQFPLECIGRYTGLPQRQPAYRKCRDHTDFLTNLTIDKPQLLERVRAAWCGPPSAPMTPDLPLAETQRIAAEKHGATEWVYRY
jgi:lipoate-protein ligase A